MRWAWAQARYAAGAKQVVEMRPGWSLICHPAAYEFAYAAQKDDPEQIAEFDSFVKTIFPGAVLFDIGAHFGLFSLATLHYGGAGAKAVAVDPSPMATSFIKKQAQLNRVSDRLHVVQAAVSDRQGWQPMVSVGILSSGYFVCPSKEHPSGETTLTPTITLDSLVQSFSQTPTHIKIDVEGYELAVLSGGLEILSKTDAPILFVELHNELVQNSGGVPQDTLSLLKHLGYQTFATNGAPVNDSAILDRPLTRIVATKNS